MAGTVLRARPAWQGEGSVGQGPWQSWHHASPALSMVWHRVSAQLLFMEERAILLLCRLKLSSLVVQAAGIPYPWDPLALLGANICRLSTECLLVLQLSRSVLYLSCLHSRRKDPGGQRLTFLCGLHGVYYKAEYKINSIRKQSPVSSKRYVVIVAK